jgi:low temperature requirement protein LtrA
MRGARGQDVAKRVCWLELFFDLVFVAAVGQVGHHPGDVGGPEGIVRHVFLLVLIWWAWHGYVGHATRFDPDTTRSRICTLLQMVAVVFMAANAEDTLDSLSTAGFVAAYGAMRLLLAVQYAGEAGVPTHRRLVWRRSAGLAVGGMAWLLSAMLPVPLRYVAWGVAVLIELGVERLALSTALDSPPHADHLPERFGLFTLILLGEGLISVMSGIQRQPVWSVPAASLALGGLSLMFLLWWVYFDLTQATSRRPVQTPDDVRQLIRWTYAHLPLYLGIALLGSEAARLIEHGGLQGLDASHAALALGALALVGSAFAALSTARRANPSLA